MTFDWKPAIFALRAAAGCAGNGNDLGFRPIVMPYCEGDFGGR